MELANIEKTKLFVKKIQILPKNTKNTNFTNFCWELQGLGSSSVDSQPASQPEAPEKLVKFVFLVLFGKIGIFFTNSFVFSMFASSVW